MPSSGTYNELTAIMMIMELLSIRPPSLIYKRPSVTRPCLHSEVSKGSARALVAARAVISRIQVSQIVRVFTYFLL